MKNLLRAFLLAIAFTSSSTLVKAADGTWAVDADGNWGDTGNWAGGVVPDDAFSKAFFTNNISATRTVTLETSHTTNAPEFSDNGAAGSSWMIAGPGQLNLSGSLKVMTPTTISANISAATFTVQGGSRLTLTGTNSISSSMGIISGVVNAVDGVGLPTAANLQFVSPGTSNQAIFESNGSFTRKTGSGAGQVRWSSLSSGGWAASGGVFNISLTNSSDVPGGALTWGAGSFVTNNPSTLSQLQLNSATADNLVDFQNAIDLGSSTRGVTVFNNPALTTDRARLSGAISGTGTLQKNGAGTLELTNSNTYGNTTVSAGTLQIGTGGTTGTLGAGSVTNNAALVFNRSDAITVSNAIGGSGSVSQLGTGTMTVTGANTYTGGTAITGGTLLANNTTGSATGTSAVTVETGATLGGTGKITGPISILAGGTLAPGNSIGALSTGDLKFDAITSTMNAELDLGSTKAADLVNVTGTLTLTNSTLNLSFANAPAFLSPTTFLLIANDGIDSISGQFGIWTNPSGYAVTLNHAFTGTDTLGRIGDGNDLAITVQSLAAVPEPTTVVVWAVALIAVAFGSNQLRKLAA